MKEPSRGDYDWKDGWTTLEPQTDALIRVVHSRSNKKKTKKRIKMKDSQFCSTFWPFDFLLYSVQLQEIWLQFGLVPVEGAVA